MHQRILILGLFLELLFLLGSVQAEGVKFPVQGNCVAWKTKKTLFLMNSLEPVGTNCQIKIELEKEGNSSRVRVLVPVSGFDSGEPERDLHVQEILKAKDFPNIVFQSDALDPKEWKTGEPKELRGKLSVAGKEVPINLTVSKDKEGNAAQGYLIAKFTTFGIEPPSVAMGVVAKVQDYLELHFRVQIPKK